MFQREPILSGPRLDIRPFEESDVGAAYVGWLNDAEVTRFSNQRFRHHDHDTCLGYVRSFAGTDNRFLLVTRRADGAPIGTLTVYASRPHGTADVGIMIGERACWGGGYGQEAWNLVIDWLLSEPAIRKVTAGTLAVNIGMVRLMERSAMSHEATRHAQEVVDGAAVDVVYHARFSDT